MKILRKIIYALVALAIVAAGGYFFTRGNNSAEQYQTVKAETTDLVQTVSETGAVKSARELDLSFKNSGAVAAVLASVGQEVAAGSPLLGLDIAALELEKKRQEAAVKMAESELRKLRSGASASDLKVGQSTADQAENAYQSALAEAERTRASAVESIRQAERRMSDLTSTGPADTTSEEQAVISAEINLSSAKQTNTQSIGQKVDSSQAVMEGELADALAALDKVNTIQSDSDARYNLSVNDPRYKDLAADGRVAALRQVELARSALDASRLADDRDKTAVAESETLAALDRTFYTLDNCYKALENSVVNSIFTQADLDTYKTSISAYITTITAGTSAVKTAKQALSTAILGYDTAIVAQESALAQARAALAQAQTNAANTLASARLAADRDNTAADSRVKSAYQSWQVALSQLDRTKAPARAEDIAIAEARLRDAQAALAAVETRLKESVISSPIAGTVTRLNFEAGEQAIAGQPAVSILGKNDYEIEVLVSEADITKVKLGDPADITLDAYGDDVHFKGKVQFIEPAETIIQEIIYYKVKASFEPAGRDLKSGMTANVIVTTAGKTGVLAIPTRAVILRNGSGKLVRVLKGGVVEEKAVTTGLRGDNGMVEVTSGLVAGEEIVVSIIEK